MSIRWSHAISRLRRHKIAGRNQGAGDHISRVLAKDLHAGMHAEILVLQHHFVIDAFAIRFAAAQRHRLMGREHRIKINRGWSGDGNLRGSGGTLESSYADPMRPTSSIHYRPV